MSPARPTVRSPASHHDPGLGAFNIEESRLVALPAGRIGLLYERGEKSAYERLTFATFPLGWLEY